MCDGKNHDLIDIVEYDINSMSSKVLRWCSTCGAIVIDVDYDGRTNPGQVMKMRFPKVLDYYMELREKHIKLVEEVKNG
jgi:hypothetical protein